MKIKSTEVLSVKNLKKSFILHNQNSIELAVFNNISFSLSKGECLVLAGSSGTGKSTLLRSIYANYLTHFGEINIYHNQSWINLVGAPPHLILDVRKRTLGYVSQFLRVIPRISTLDLVAEPLLSRGETEINSIDQAKDILKKLAIPANLWDLPPATFSGGEQQRVNIAITFVRDLPILLLDEPTASLDTKNKQAVIDLIKNAKDNGTAIIGIFHDENVRDAVGTTIFDIEEAKQVA
jgi:alpha-D-ribose 1-methylphosphonate 5-triphosphate synthase subunit PhnL